METHPVTRSINLEGMVDEYCENKIHEHLAHLNGVLKAEVSSTRGKLRVEYDLYEIQLAVLEEAMATLGYPFSTDWFSSLKHGWLKFSEENEISNLKHKPHCCNKAPR